MKDNDKILQNHEGNLRILEEKISEYVDPVNVPVQIIKNRDELIEKIGEIKKRQSQPKVSKKWGINDDIDSKSGGERTIIISEKEDIFKSVQVCLDYGDYISAKNILLGFLPYDELPIDTKLYVIIIEQKYGLIKDARKHMNAVIGQNNWHKIPQKLQAQFNLLNLKLLSQEHHFDKIIDQYDSVTKSLVENEQEEYLCQVYWRVGFSYAAQEKLADSKLYLKQALQLALKNKEKNSEVTVKVMSAIAHIFRGVDVEFDTPLDFITKGQTIYLQAPANIKLWQVNRLKSSVQSLFAEAAYYLTKGDDKGRTRLITANILTQMVKSNPYAEGYSELIALVPEGILKKRIKLAMYSDEGHRDKFQKKNSQQLSMYLRGYQEVIYQLREPTAKNWCKFRKIYEELDKKFN